MRGPLLEKHCIPLIKKGIGPPEDAAPLVGTPERHRTSQLPVYSLPATQGSM
jgi:hypothetical protein